MDKDKSVDDGWIPKSYPIPSHWLYTELETAFDNLSLKGKKLAQKSYEANGVFPVVDQGVSEIGGYSNDKGKLIYLERPAIVFGDHTKCLKYINFSFVPGADGVKVLVPNAEIDSKYAFYACKSLRLPDRGYSRHYSFLKKCSFPLPPFKEQKRIVAKIEELFSELDNGIAALKTAREQLKAYRQAVLKHAFEGKLTAQWRAENQDKLETLEQLLTRIQQEREARYQQQLEDWKTAVKEWEANGKKSKKPSKPTKLLFPRVVTSDDLPLLPSGWAWIEYAGICEKIRNGVSAKPIGETGNKILRISAVRAMKFDLNDTRYLQDIDGQYSDYFLSKGDLVFTRYNGTRDYVGVCAEYRGDGTHLYPDKLIQTRTAVSSISPSYLEKAINSGGSRKFIEKRIRTTAGQSGISGGDIKSMPVPICCKEEQKIIERHLESELSNVTAISDEIESGLKKAETLRQSILKKAFSGQLVPQDPNDEPASELLARIQAEKAAANARKKAAAKSKVSAKPAARRGNLSRVTP